MISDPRDLAQHFPAAPGPAPTNNHRTEDLGEAGILPIRMGGVTHELRTLTIRESRAWRRVLAEAIARLDAPAIRPGEGAADLLDHLFEVGDEERVAILVAYDVDRVLGGRDSIEDTMRSEELAPAVEAVLEAQRPFGTAAVPSTVAAFGRPAVRAAALLRMLEAASAPGSSRTGPSDSGASPTPTSSGPGPSSSSSSDGPTPSDDSSASTESSGT